jgi:hypothetical protein
MKKLTFILFTFTVTFWIISCSGTGSSEQESSETDSVSTEMTSAKVYFISPNDGDTVSSPLMIDMGLEGMEIDPAGEVKEGMGHHHLVINGSHIQEGVVVPTDSVHIHYGLGQIRDTVELAPGNYTLTLQFADGFHQSYGKPLSSTINVVVKDNNL